MLIFGVLLLGAVLGSAGMSGQISAEPPQGEAVARAAGSITAEALTGTPGLWTGDTMHGPDAGARTRVRDARVALLAEQFRALGLQPLVQPKGDTADALVQRYPVPNQLRFDHAKSSVKVFQELTGATRQPVWVETGDRVLKVVSVGFDAAAYFAPEVGPPLVGELVPISFHSALIAGSSRAMLVAGPQTPATLHGAELADKVIFYVPAAGVDSATRRQVLTLLYRESQGVIVVTDLDSAAFMRQLQDARQQPIPVVEGYMRKATADRWPWAIVARAAELRGLWHAVGLDEARLRAVSAPLAVEIPSTEVWLYPAIDSVPNVTTAPDVIGILEGADSTLKNESIMISASLEEPGLSGLLALARAFSQPGARPRRSIIFLAASGGTADWAGTWFFADPLRKRRYPKLRNRVAGLTIGPFAPLPGDSLVIDGSADFTFGVAPVWIAAAHPELGLHPVDGGTAFRPGTAGYAFASSSLPTLAFHGMNGGSTTSAGPLTSRDAERAASALRLVFYVAQELANTTNPIQWTEAGRSQYVGPPATQP